MPRGWRKKRKPSEPCTRSSGRRKPQHGWAYRVWRGAAIYRRPIPSLPDSFTHGGGFRRRDPRPAHARGAVGGPDLRIDARGLGGTRPRDRRCVRDRKVGKVKAILEKQVADGMLWSIAPPPIDVLLRIIRLGKASRTTPGEVRDALPVV